MVVQGGSLNLQQIFGDQFSLSRTHQGHFAAPGDKVQEIGEENFGNMLMKSLNEVNSLQNQANDLALTAALAPDQVEAHDVTIAAAKAELALNLTKNVVDRVIQGYKDIINLR
ncbi:flagellar hook-basal body complex protein FliE [Spirochaeta dissipatitropha]